MNLAKYEAMPDLINTFDGFFNELEDMQNACFDYLSAEEAAIEREEMKAWKAEQEYQYDLRLAKLSGSLSKYRE